MGVRELLWEYPLGVMWLVRKFSFFFIVLAGVASGVVLVALLSLFGVNKYSKVVFDGTLKYGIVSDFDVINPLEVNPSDAEQLAAKLLYNGLVTIDSSGQIYPELAETWTMSPDGKEYTFYLKKGVLWHDKYEFTSKDVAATFELLQSGDTETVSGAIAKDVEVIVRGTYEVSFILKQVNVAFLELLTMPILPQHLYADTSYSRLVELSDLVTPIGTGPYRYLRRESNGIVFQANSQYFKGVPTIKTIRLTIYETPKLAEAAFLEGKIHAFSPVFGDVLERQLKLSKESPRVSLDTFVQSNNVRLLLFNLQKEGVGTDAQLRKGIAQSVDRTLLANLVPGAVPAYGPYDVSSYVYLPEVESINPYSLSEANAIFDENGWKYPYSGAPYRLKTDKELSLSLTFLDSEINREVALGIRDQLAKVGVNISLRGVSSDTMLQTVLPQKDYELLLFEIHTGIDPDQYGLWHSSQSTFPGLNLSGYNSPLIDSLIEKGRLQTNQDKRLEIFQQFQTELVKEAVAIFLYRPSYYEASFDIIDRKLQGTVIDPSDVFNSVYTWKILPGWRNWQTR